MLRTLKFIINHPITKARPIAAIWNFVRWQISSRLNSRPVIYQFTPKSKLLVWNGLTGATGNIYCGLHEFEDMAFLLHFLRTDDLFADIGANIGSYTVLASAEVEAITISIEPIPATSQILKQNIDINAIGDRVNALNIGLGSKPSTLNFTASFDTGNHVATANEQDIISVPVDTLDNILQGQTPALLKIDVEGFEAEVLSGGGNTLKKEGLKAIIIELNGSGERYGFCDSDIHLKLTMAGFQSMRYQPIKRKLTLASPSKEHNTLYVRDIEYVNKRVINAPQILIKKMLV